MTRWFGGHGYGLLAAMFPSGELQVHATGGVILVAEDDENDVFLIRPAFHQAQFDHPLQVVPSGIEAIAYLEGESLYEDRAKYPLPALLLLDLNMP